MSIWDSFSGTAGRNTAIWAANNTNTGLDEQRNFLNTGSQGALAALGQGYNQGRSDVAGGTQGALSTLTNARNAALQMQNRNPALLNQNYGQAQTYLGNAGQQGDQVLAGAGTSGDRLYANAFERGDQLLRQSGAEANAYYQPLAAGANRGFSAYGDAAGINGAAGQNRARQNFRTGPGYEFTVNEGVNAATRAANASGMAASGNTLDATTRLGANLADKEYDDYVSRLSPYLNLAPQIAGQQAGIAQQTGLNRTNLGTQIAGQRANLGANIAGQRANLGQQTAQSQATLQSQLGQQLAANNLSLANLYTGYGQQAGAAQQAQGNQLGSLATGYGTNQANVVSDLARNLSNVTGAANTAITNQGQAGLMAGQTASANSLNASLETAKLLATLAGKGSGTFS